MTGWLLCGLLTGASLKFADAAPHDARRPPAIATEEVPLVPLELAERLRQYQSVRLARFRGWAPDKSGILIQTQFGNTQQLHHVAEPGAARTQLTFFEEPVSGSYLPGRTANQLLLTTSAGGNENFQIFRADLATSQTLRLTDGASRNLLGPVSLNGQRYVFASNRRNGRDMDLYLADPQDPDSTREILRVTNESWQPMSLSGDGQRLLINHYVSINETYPAILDLKTLQLQKLPLPPQSSAKIAWGTLAFAADGESVWATCDARGEFQDIYQLDLAKLVWKKFDLQIPWDCNTIVIDPNTFSVAVTHNVNGVSELRVFNGNGWEDYDLPLGIVSDLEFSPDATQLGFTLARPAAPSDAYSLTLSNNELTRWTASEVGGLNANIFQTAERVQFPTFDGRQIPGYLLLPEKRAGKVPVLISIHGGPESQYQPFFSGLDQFFANELGIAVIAPNVRGSAGYGKTYLQLDNGDKREDSVKDIGAVLDWIAQHPELDADRVAVTGGSYGGYMVLASLAHYPERIRAGIDIVGIANFITFLERTSEYRRDLRRAEYGDERDPHMRAVFERINPTSNVHKIRSALLVAHGKNDPRVPFYEAEQIAPLVRKNGQPVWTVYADNEGHGFAKRANRDYLTAVMVLFLQQHLIAPVPEKPVSP